VNVHSVPILDDPLLVLAGQSQKAMVKLLRKDSSSGDDAMYELTEIIAEFAIEAEAQVALVRLRMDRIQAQVVGHVPTAASFSLFGRLPFAPIQIVVVRSQAERARFILAAAGVEVLEHDWENLAENAVDGWICTLCDTEVEHGEDVCPICHTSRFEYAEEI
jgi:rubrerythrin